MASNSNTQSTPDGQPDSESHKQNGTSQLQTLPGSETDTESTTCEFTLDIADWNEVHDTNIDVADDPTWDESVWNCYRKVPAEGDTNYCIFHQNTPEADGVEGREKVRIAKHVSEDDIAVPGDGNINVEPSQVFLDLVNGSPDPDDWTEDGQEFPDEIWQVDEKQTNTANEYKRRRKQFIGTVLGDVELTRESLDADDMYPIDLRCVRIINGFDAKNAEICHDLKMQGAQVETLSLNSADVDGDVSLDSADVDGWVSLNSADVDGDVSLKYADVDVDGAVSLRNADVDGDVSLRNADVDVDLRLSFVNADVDGRVSFVNADVDGGISLGPTGDVTLRNADVDGGVSLRNADVDVDGGVSFVNADVDGGVSLNYADVDVDRRVSLESANVDGDVSLKDADVDVDWDVSLKDADVDGDVSLKDADVDGDVSLKDADVDGTVSLGPTGDVTLESANVDVDGAVSFVDADVVRIIIENSYINDRLSFNQTVAEDCHLRNSIVGDDINLSEITLTGGLYIGYHNDNDDDSIDPVVTGGVVTLEDATIEGECHLCCVPDHPAVGAVVIDDATIESGRFHHIERDTRDTVDYRFSLDSENTVCGFSNSDSNKPNERSADGLVYEFERATLGQTEIAHDSDDSFEHARFLETAFDGFVFSRERDKFRSTGWNVHKPREGGYRDIAIVTQTPPAETESDDSDSYPDTVFGAAQQKVETQIDTWLDMDESNHTETIKTARELVPEDIDTDTDTDTDNLIKPQPGSGDPVTKALKKCHNLKHLEILERIPRWIRRKSSGTETEDEGDSESPFRSRRAKEIQADPDRVAKALVTDSNAAWVASRRVEQIRRSLSIVFRDLPDDVSIPKDITDVSDSDFVGQIVTFLDSHPDHDGSVREILTHDDTEFEFPGETVDTVDKRAAVKVSRLARAIHDDRKTLTNKHIIETSFRSRQKSTEDSASGGGDDSEDTDTGSNPNPDTDTDTDTSTSESQDDDNERKQLDNNPGQLEQNPGGETEPPDSLVADAILNTEAVRKAEQKARWLQEDAEYLTARYLSDPEAVTGSNNDLESTYVEAKNGASDMGDEVAAGNFFQIERAYGRRQHWDGFKGELGQKNGSNTLNAVAVAVAVAVGVGVGVFTLLSVLFGLTGFVGFLAAVVCALVSLVLLSIGLCGIRRSRMLYKWIANVFLWVTTGYGEKPMRVLGSSLGIILGFAVIFAQFGSGAFKPGPGPHGESGWVPYLILSFESFVTLVLGSPNIDNRYLRLVAEIEGFIGIFTIGLFVFTLTRAIHR